MATSCEICGGSTSARGTYRALDDAGQTVRDFPAVECAKCGHVFPDADQIGEMRPSQVPSSVRIRCARRVPADSEGEWPGQVRGLGHGGQTTSPVSASMRDASGREAVGHTVLVVEDDIAARGALERVLFAAGYRVSVARDGPDATESVMVRSFDVIISGEFVRETSGITLLRAIRSRDLDVPVLLLTEAPSPETAAMAEALGATGYLTKPLRGADLISSVEHARTLGTLMKAKRDALALGTRTEGTIVRRSGLDVTLARALAATRIATQPIVDPRQWHVFAQEVVVGSDEPMMATSAQLFEAAERLGRLRELGRAVRSLAAESPATDGAKLFVRLHASDLTDEDLYSPSAPLSKIAKRVVLEVAEGAPLEDIPDLGVRVAKLRAIGFQLCIDDFGTAHAGLTRFMHLAPCFAKLSSLLVRGIHADGPRMEIVRSIGACCARLRIGLIAPGVDDTADRDALAALGCHLQQGSLFGSPTRAFAAPSP